MILQCRRGVAARFRAVVRAVVLLEVLDAAYWSTLEIASGP